ncbi:MAG: hypothetical protein AAFX86_08950 [Pseudomonadota bacterium]
MNTRSQILRWREIVHPFFWPVFFWNLWKFSRFLRLRIEASGNGLISFQVTWWGAIRIYDVIDPDAPSWDAGLEECTDRLQLAKLDVGNPYLSYRAPLSQVGMAPGSEANVLSMLTSLTTRTRHAGKGRRMALALGCFAEPSHLNTS